MKNEDIHGLRCSGNQPLSELSIFPISQLIVRDDFIMAESSLTMFILENLMKNPAYAPTVQVYFGRASAE